MRARSVWPLFVALLLIATPWPVAAQPVVQSGTATLSIVAVPVDVQAPYTTGFTAGSDGQTLAVGSRVRTGTTGRAVLTFFDGTTAALDAGTEVTLDRVQPSGEQPGGLLVGVGLTAGRVWSQVSSLLNRGSSFEVQAAGATAVAREGVTGFALDEFGNLWCWGIAGQPLRVRTASGERELAEGYEAGFPPPQAAGADTPPRSNRGELGVVRPRAFGAGVLEVRGEGAAQVRLVTPRDFTIGFPLPDLVVNQVQDATTSLPTGPSRWIRIPGPVAGAYRLVLEPTASGPYHVQVVLSADSGELFNQDLQGMASPGQPLIADLTIDARDGAPVGAQLSAARPLTGPAPGSFVYP